MAKKNPEIPTLTERIEEYLRTVKPPEEEVKYTWAEKVGLALFSRVSDFFTIMWDKVWENFRKALNGIVEDIFHLFFKQFVAKATPGIKEALKEVIQIMHYPEPLNLEMFERVDKERPLDYVSVFITSIATEVMKIAAVLGASHELARQDQYKVLQPSLPGVADIFSAKFRDPKWEPVIDDYMMKMGFNEETRNMIKLVSWTLLNPDQIKQLFLRGEITKLEKNTMLKALGIREEDLDKLEKLYYFIPGPGDLVRMAVREAFYPDYIAKYGLGEEYPPEFEEWAKKQGMSPFWSKKFWYSHWVLPTIMQGYEMLHRGVISKDDLDSLFRAVDIMPYWRDKLLAISYSPYTRIDIRRMYRTGVVDRAEVKKTYLALGYDDEHAENLTEFTVRDALASEKDLSRADIVGAYQRKLISRSDSKSLIMQLGYSTEESEIYLDRADFDSFKKDKDKKLSWVRKNYLDGLITHSEASGRLSKLNLKGEEISELFRDWDIEKEGKITALTFKQLQVLLIEKIIDEATFKAELANKGYSDKYIEWLMKLTKQKVVEGD